jgi:hypothetical protein
MMMMMIIMMMMMMIIIIIIITRTRTNFGISLTQFSPISSCFLSLGTQRFPSARCFQWQAFLYLKLTL